MTTSQLDNQEKEKQAPETVILLSGGIDSAGLIALYRVRRKSLQAIHFDYGQPPRKAEWEAASKIANYYDIPIKKILIEKLFVRNTGEYLVRNAQFILSVASRLGERPIVIASGIHSGSLYYDTKPIFVADMQRILDGYFGGSVLFDAPFIDYSKPEVVAFCHRHNVPLKLTYSCERKNVPCGKCLSCIDRRTLNIE